MDIELNYERFNPNAYWLLDYMSREEFRYIIMYGGSSSGKSFSCAQTILVQTLLDQDNTIVLRKVGATIQKSIYEDFKVSAKALGIFHLFRFTMNTIKCLINDAKIDFSGLDDPEKIKGISNYKRVLLEEWSEFDEADFKQIRKRLRGKRGQQIICTFNPISQTHWIKKKVFDEEVWTEIPMQAVVNGTRVPEKLCRVKSVRINSAKNVLNHRTGEIETHSPDMVVIQSTYLNNFWVVGSPNGKYGYYDSQCIADFDRDRVRDPEYYNVYALGEWGVLRTGGEFLSSFNVGVHTKAVEYDSELPIHISIDNNVLPFISISYWQADLSGDKVLRQIGETTASSPNNTARRAAKIVAERLLGEFNTDKVFLHGDATTRASNTIDDEKRSFLDLFIQTMEENGVSVHDVVGTKNPSVPISGEFVNAILDGHIDGVSLEIGNNCLASIEDYQSVQKDANGSILKNRVRDRASGQSYEEHGHLTDTMRYFVTDVLSEEFMRFSNRRKRNVFAQDGMLHFISEENAGKFKYNESILYIMPSINGKLLYAIASNTGLFWYVNKCGIRESGEKITGIIEQSNAGTCVVECGEAYFQNIRIVRESVSTQIKVIRQRASYTERIQATREYVTGKFYFLESGDEEYCKFLDNLLDYRGGSESFEASALLSGLAQYIIRGET